MPKISIILPTYNGAKRIARAIQSVQKQSLRDWELLVVIDGSTDGTFSVVSDIAKNDERIRIVNNKENQGIQKTLNNGIKKSTGVYIARIDDDDEWCDNEKLQKQFNFLESNPEYGLVGSGIVLVNKNGDEIDQYLFVENDNDIRKTFLSQNHFAHPSVMFRKSIFEKTGLYSEKEEHKHVEDHEFWLRIGKYGKLKNLSEYLINYQIREGSISGRNKELQLRRRLMLCIQYRKDYPNFIKNFLKILFVYVGYVFVGWIFIRFPKIRGKITSLYKKLSR